LFFLFLFPVLLRAQNLLMNGGFEDENICTEYEKNCAPEGWISTSLYADYYFDDAPNAFEGNHFVGLVLAGAERLSGRNFLRSRLLCGLRKGAQYRLIFHIRSLHNVFDSIGVYFSTTDFLYQKEKLRNAKPQLWLKQDSSLQPSKDWQQVSFLYTANGDENFLSIGDFKKWGHSFTGRPDLGREYYFFLDSISLTPVNPHEHLCVNAAQLKEEEYSFNVRHTLLDRLIYVHTKNPPPVEPLPKTTVQRIDTLVIPDVLFATNSYALNPQAKTLLDSFLHNATSLQVDSLVVEGHTDNQGTHSLNQKLSENRAAAVAAYLAPAFNRDLQTRGWANERPVADNRTTEGRQKNRRVELYLYIRED
jgi:outer membrane protein OmpA-like peptidoglycan-associated protein